MQEENQLTTAESITIAPNGFKKPNAVIYSLIMFTTLAIIFSSLYINIILKNINQALKQQSSEIQVLSEKLVFTEEELISLNSRYGELEKVPPTINSEIPSLVRNSKVNDVEVKDVEYLFIPEWGIKFKKPSAISDIKYFIDNSSFSEEIIFTAMIAGDSNPREYYDSYTECGGIARFGRSISKSENLSPNLQIGQYYYFWQAPQSICSTTKEDQLIEQRVGSLLLNMYQTVEQI